MWPKEKEEIARSGRELVFGERMVQMWEKDGENFNENKSSNASVVEVFFCLCERKY